MESALKSLRERQKERGNLRKGKKGEGEGTEPVFGIPNSSKPSENSRKVPFRTSVLGHIISTVSRYSEGSRGSCEWFVRVYWLSRLPLPLLPFYSSLQRFSISLPRGSRSLDSSFSSLPYSSTRLPLQFSSLFLDVYIFLQTCIAVRSYVDRRLLFDKRKKTWKCSTVVVRFC